ncbi:hypothetical protein J6590_018821 [Homalodisca vitripennis]|nr:hypothetical protein J6590_018821 [Homalodisca vitripennis]
MNASSVLTTCLPIAVAYLLPVEVFCRMLTFCMVHKVLYLKKPQYLSERLRSREELVEQCVRQRGSQHFRG